VPPADRASGGARAPRSGRAPHLARATAARALRPALRDRWRGQLSAEREFLSTAALARLGRTAEARRRVAALESRHPESAYAARAARLIPDAAWAPGTL
jgi:hypothetical protein